MAAMSLQSPDRWLLVADTSVPEALGSKLLQAAEQLHLQPQVSYSSPAPHFSPSMGRRRGKVFYRFADRRSWEWWGYQKQLLSEIERQQPQLVLVTGILPLDPQVFSAITAQGCRVVNWLTDDPWNPIHRRRSFLANLPLYHHIFSTKKALQRRLRLAGVASTSWLPFAYHPPLHHAPLPATAADSQHFAAAVAFVGTGARERLPWLQAAAAATEFRGLDPCRLYGASWQGLATPGWQRQPIVRGDNYCKALYHARVVLGLLRAANHDRSTDRSYEIGAIGACGLMQDSDEHRALLPEYPEEGFFSSPQELQQRCALLLQDDALCQHLRECGARALRRPEHTYGARLGSVLQWWAAQR
jgi:hypothetical protein